VNTAASQPIAFLGPEGTFSEEALLAHMPAGAYHPFPYPSIREVLGAVQAGEAPLGIVPIENSIEGSVVVTLDSLAFGFDDLRVVREVTWQVHQQLIARRPVDFDRVTKIVSIPHAYGQCREFIREHLDGVEHEATDSTAEAVRRVSRVERPWVAIGTRLAAEMYECVVVAADVDDVGPRLGKCHAVPHGRLRAGEQSPVREGVGGDVEHPEHASAPEAGQARQVDAQVAGHGAPITAPPVTTPPLRRPRCGAI